MTDDVAAAPAAVPAAADAARLPVQALFTPCDAGELDFATTAEIEALDEAIGQQRAAEAVHYAMGMRHAGYNLFAFGPTGTGKYDFVRGYAERIAAGWAVPSEWCYVHNFAEPHKPRAIRLPPGKARPFHDDTQQLIDELRHAIPAAFESEEYRNRKNVIQEQFKERQEEGFNALQAR
ncbi:MAG: Lon-like protease helical domain-containing protein, partial [Rhodospirillales bacterium]